MAASPTVASKTEDISDRIKPYKHEALIRLRNSTVSLVALVVTTHVLPLPSLWTAVNVVRDHEQGDTGILWGVCATELVFLALLTLNIAQAAYALRYPRKPHPTPIPSAKALQVTPQSRKKRQSILSPEASTGPRAPQRTSSLYTSSPLSTPSRTLYYSMPSTPSPFGVSLTSSTSSMPPTPSPSLGAYHARHGGSAGEPFDGLTLSRLADAQRDEED
ncbi:hypothetical protein EDC04DRAFT_2664402 [Pisolithus marmoratus]|nr:hypothetical protein EDC04DRAFT_2664402 [Pisolithus marmoratus]